MGYTTDFYGEFKLNKKLDKNTFDYLKKFKDIRHVKRKLPAKYGIEGEFYVDGDGFKGQGDKGGVVDHNSPPSTQPGLWCQWEPCEDRKHIMWDGDEKFYEYKAWLVYLIKNFLAPKGYILNGEVEFQGENRNDRGIITVTNNKVKVENHEDLMKIKKENQRLRTELDLQESILED